MGCCAPWIGLKPHSKTENAASGLKNEEESSQNNYKTT